MLLSNAQMGKDTRLKKESWLVPSYANPRAELRLFCFPYAGGAASLFRTWHRLADTVEIYPIQLPGRANRYSEPPFSRVQDLVEQLAPAIAKYLDKSFAFFGHSMGAILSFEVARWLRRHGKVLPRRLFVSARRAPQIPDTEPLRYLLSDADLITSLSELNGIPEELIDNDDLLRFALPAIRADLELVETYAYREEAPLTCPITAFGGLNDNEESPEMIDDWRRQTSGGFSMHIISGDHFYIHSREEELLKLLRRELDRILVCV
jgi:medium-chain acyl-[acyl-carrier-protein] hydrolase